MQDADYDLCVIGGGINGAGIARDAALRGMSVILLEADDLAGATSSASTKLIHGGLRYLEFYEFGLVRDSLRERETLLSLAPHIIRPMDFVLPHDGSQRPYWMIRFGLFLYDHLAPRKKLHRSRGLNLRQHNFGNPLKDAEKGFCYADCWVEDARLVVLNAMDAAQNGAAILPRTACTKLQHKKEGLWHVEYEGIDGSPEKVTAAMTVNATGPWVRKFLEDVGLDDFSVPRVRLVKGSHIIIPRSYDGDHAYILQQPDGRIVFTIPYEKNYTLIGTTEEDYTGDPRAARISNAETQYLCAAYNRSFKKQIMADDVISTYSGVRPLLDDGEESVTAVTRDYVLHRHTDFAAPLISVFGGKLTTYRVLSEKLVDKLCALKGAETESKTTQNPLPGGDVPGGDMEKFLQQKSAQYDFIPPGLLQRYAHSYGTQIDIMLRDISSLEAMGTHYGDGIYEAEIRYLVRYEWAAAVEDILWRRSKLGLHISGQTRKNLEAALPKITKEF